MISKSHRNALFLKPQMNANGFWDRGPASSQVDAMRDHYGDSLSRSTNSSTGIMTNRVQMAALPLKNETSESGKVAGIARPLIRKKRTVARFR